jgi:hypothetical protein
MTPGQPRPPEFHQLHCDEAFDWVVTMPAPPLDV